MIQTANANISSKIHAKVILMDDDPTEDNHLVNKKNVDAQMKTVQDQIDSNLINKYLSKQPSRFLQTDPNIGEAEPIVSTVDTITFNWKSGDPETVKLSINNGQQLPIIDHVRILVKKHGDDDNSYQHVEHGAGGGNDHPGNTRSFTFQLNSTYGGIEFLQDTKIAIRVYGINSCNDVPSVSDRTLTFEQTHVGANGIGFLASDPPSKPQFSRIIASNRNNMIGTHWTVAKVPAPLKLTHYQVVYQAVESHRTIALTDTPVISTAEIPTDISNGPVAQFVGTYNTDGVEFSVQTQADLFPGTSYKMKCRVKNSSNENYSDTSDFSSTPIFTLFPNRSNYQYNNINFNNQSGSITTRNFNTLNEGNVSNKYYKNIYSSNSAEMTILDWHNENKQLFEITDSSTQLNNDKIGSVVDQDETLWKLLFSYKIGTAAAKTGEVNFSMNGTSSISTGGLTPSNFIDNLDTLEALSGNNVGFRKNGQFKLKNITNKSSGGVIEANGNKQTFNINLSSQFNNNSRSYTSGEFYLDELVGNPTCSLDDPGTTNNYIDMTDVTTEKTCGIASLKTFSVTYPKSIEGGNINSSYRIRPRTIATITNSSNKIIGLGNQTFAANQYTADLQGNYSFTPAKQSNLRLNQSNHDESNVGFSLNCVTSNMNGNSTPQVTKSLNTAAVHCDRESYNGNVETRKCPAFGQVTLSSGTTISSAQNIGNIADYTNHDNLVSPNHTPVFYGGKFCSNHSTPSPYRQFNDQTVNTGVNYTNHGAVSTKIIAFKVNGRSVAAATQIFKDNSGNLDNADYNAYIYFSYKGEYRMASIFNDGSLQNFSTLSSYWQESSSTDANTLGAWHGVNNEIALPFEPETQTSNMYVIFQFSKGHI